MQPTFSQFLTESKNLHLEHLEEEIVNFGYEGAVGALNFLKSVEKMVKGHTGKHFNITVKWDGAPAIFCGTNPENGKFFVGTKSVFNKTNPKINYTVADIKKNHDGELAEKLIIALKNLPALGIKGVLQGDMMFTHGDLKPETIDGEKYITFMPNTIVYAVPAKSNLAVQMSKAKLGVIFHTAYTGETMADMKASFKVNVNSLKKSPNVWFDDATYRDESGSVTMTNAEDAKFSRELEAAQAALKNLSKSKFNNFVNQNPKLVALIKIHLNSKIRGGKHIGDPEVHVESLIEFIHDRFEKEKEKVKTDKAKQSKEERKQAKHGVIDKNKQLMIDLFTFQHHINEAKLVLIRKLEEIKHIGHFLKTKDGFKVTSPEGFVAVDHLTDKAVKLVDRLEFSRANFSTDKEWTK